MNHKRLFRKIPALIGAVLLCFLGLIPTLFVPASASIQDPVTITFTSGKINTEILRQVVTNTDTGKLEITAPEWHMEYNNNVLSLDDRHLLTIYDEEYYLTMSLEQGTESYPIRITFFDDGTIQEMIMGDNITTFMIQLPDGAISQSVLNIFKSAGAEVEQVTEYDRGYENGFNAGYSSGQETGYESGYGIGYDEGEKAGYNAGFSAGQTEAMNSNSKLKDLIFGIFSAPGELINGILDFNLFGINVASLVKTLITLAVVALIVVFLIKLMRR